MKKHLIAAACSVVVPGAGHCYLGRYKKGWPLIVLTAAIWCTFVLSKALIIKWLMLGVFFAAMVPAVVETYLLGQDGKHASMTDTPAYIVFMLLTTGLGALPLLWQTPVFSKRAKIAWTIAVPLLAIAFIALLWMFKEAIQGFLQRLPPLNFSHGRR